MKFGSLLFSLLMLKSAVYSQSNSSKSKQDSDEVHVFTKVELNAGPANRLQWERYLRQAAIVPDSVSSTLKPGTYKVVVQFIVDIHGSLVQAKVANDCPGALAKRSIEAIRKYPGSWQPATQCGRQVKSYHEQILIYKIGE
jgi:hypothetical protein